MAQLGSRNNPWVKDPNEVDTFSVTWATRLNGETLSTSVFSLVSGTVVIDTYTNNTTIATVTLSGGAAGEKNKLLNRVTTSGGKTLDRSVYVKVKQL